jgi:hypothetical protein
MPLVLEKLGCDVSNKQKNNFQLYFDHKKQKKKTKHLVKHSHNLKQQQKIPKNPQST